MVLEGSQNRAPKIKGNHHLQGNVQVYNVRIPAKGEPLHRLDRNGTSDAMEKRRWGPLLPPELCKELLLQHVACAVPGYRRKGPKKKRGGGWGA